MAKIFSFLLVFFVYQMNANAITLYSGDDPAAGLRDSIQNGGSVSDAINSYNNRTSRRSKQSFGSNQQGDEAKLDNFLSNYDLINPSKENQDYKGFSGRNLREAHYTCHYYTYRSTPIGKKHDGLSGALNLVKVRTNLYNSCMNSQGFFAKNKNISSFPAYKTFFNWADVTY